MTEREAAWADLMRAANGGNAEAYDRLLRALAAVMRPLARRGLTKAGRSTADAEDIVQDILLAVHLKRHTWDSSQPIGPWLRAIARYKLIDALRRRGGEAHASIDEVMESLPAEEAEHVPAGEVVRQLERLPPGQRDVVRVIALEGCSISEAAFGLKMTEGAVRVALHRGLHALRNLK